MTSRLTDIQHTFGGGWATDFGPNVTLTPDAANRVTIPFLVEADNAVFDLDGGPVKIGGTAKLNATVLESGAAIYGFFDFWKQGTGGSPSQKRIVHVNDVIKMDAADGVFADIFTGLEVGKVPSYSQQDDKLIIASDSKVDVPKVTDQSTHADLGGTPPNFAFSETHHNRQWAAGDVSQPSRLYYSAFLDPEDWIGAGSGFIDIDPGDGDAITGIASFLDDMWVFKGPRKGSIHRITGTAPTGDQGFGRITFLASGLGSVNHNTIFRYRDDLAFMWSDGAVHSLKAVASFGDFNELALTRPFNNWLRDHANQDLLRLAWSSTNDSFGHVRITLPTDSSTTNNVVLNMDYRFDPVRWSPHKQYTGACLATMIDNTTSGLRVFVAGGNDGFLRKLDQANKAIDGTTSISYRVQTPHIQYSHARQKKWLYGIAAGIEPKGAYDLIVGWERDDFAQQTGTVAQGGGDVLAPAPSGFTAFTLGTSALAGGRYVDRYLETIDGGEFSTIRYEFRNAGLDEDAALHSFLATIGPGAMVTEA